MKLEFVGGHEEEVAILDEDGRFVVDEEGKPRTERREQLTQMLEEMEYHWPEAGAVLSVPDNVGAWLIGKLGGLVRPLPAEKNEAPKGAPNRLVAIKPEKKPRASTGGEGQPSTGGEGDPAAKTPPPAPRRGPGRPPKARPAEDPEGGPDAAA